MDSWSGGTGILQWLYGVEMLCVSSGQMTRVAPEFGDHQPISMRLYWAFPKRMLYPK